MGFLKLYRNAHEEILQKEKILQISNYKVTNHVENVVVESCFYVQWSNENSELSSSDSETQLKKKLISILGDPWIPSQGLCFQSKLEVGPGTENLLIEIGPRLSYSTPWSTNCVSICKSAGIQEVDRLEKAFRYLIGFSSTATEEEKSEFLKSLYDPMTHQVYETPLTSFGANETPEKWYRIDVMTGGRRALEDANKTMGLSFDDWDLDYYTQLFCEKIRRNPTSVELFDLAQSNSEHSRHWFFKGLYEMENTTLPISLLDMVIATNSPETTNANNVIKFSDNSSGIKGWSLPAIIPSNPLTASEFKVETRQRHIIFTAETHNFPTGVSPFSGATTGTGGRIRDIQAAGRGGHVIAGTAGYCFGNLHIPGYVMEWEKEGQKCPPNFATPLEIALQASNGASDYGNKFGEPVISGFARSFGMDLDAERREWIKPIMFSGGIGSLDEGMVNKDPPHSSQLVVKVGGPVYRIGVGGGAASSVQVQGDNAVSRDFKAVQRGDAEMEQKMNRVIRGCLEMEKNPILSIHDQGAGGNANVLKELMEGAGGVIYTKAFSLGDPTLSTLEIWGAEYQESNAVLVNPSAFDKFQTLAKRERCPVDKVGVITNDRKVRVFETDFLEEIPSSEQSEDIPVSLELDWVLGKMPQKVFKWEKMEPYLRELSIPDDVTAMSALSRVLRLPSVASKKYLTNKVDRSVTGLIAQQQCVGPLQFPLADVAVTALSYFSKEGAATSVGEQPIKILVNPESGARLTVLEALSNLASCLISDLKDVKCSANWMWAAKLPGEGSALYRTCKAMCDVMVKLGVAVDGGKDSLSMAARVPDSSCPEGSRVVKGPGALVVSAYAPCPDITKVITPDLKSPGRKTEGSLILLKPAFDEYRLGGSALAQVYAQIGNLTPDLDDAQVQVFVKAFNAIQQLIKSDLLLSAHDISDGGFITCVVEMAIGGWGGVRVNLPEFEGKSLADPVLALLFNEEVGWVLEVETSKLDEVLDVLKGLGLGEAMALIGKTGCSGESSMIEVLNGSNKVLSLTVGEAATLWEETSYHLEMQQMNPKLAEKEFKSLRLRTHFDYRVCFKWNDTPFNGLALKYPQTPKMAVLREEGSNGDREMAAAFIQAGFIVYDVTMSDLEKGSVSLDMFRGIAFPGGFSYADVLGSGMGWASSIKEKERLSQALDDWRNTKTHFSLGVCNGCQLIAHLGWIGTDNKDTPTVKLDSNDSNRFESRWSCVTVTKSNSVLMRGMEGSVLGVWVAHGQGKFTYKPDDLINVLIEKGCVPLRYANDRGAITEEYPFNPNGSQGGIAGLTSICGRHLALMPHPERCFLPWQCPYPGTEKSSSSNLAPWSRLFQNAFDWCLVNQ